MLRFNLLGAVDLLDDADNSSEVRIGPKPLALLVYLLIEGRERTIRRDTAAALLWPESRNARASLTQAFYELRCALGEHVVWKRGKEEIGVDVAYIDSDCFEFTELAGRGSLEECVGLYRGDFANGLHVKDAQPFEDWLEQQRHRWRRYFADVLRELYRSAIARDDLQKAGLCAERLIDVDPADDTPVSTLVSLLIERGQTRAAKKLYDAYAHKLHSYLECDPPAELSALMNAVRESPDVGKHPPLHIAAPKWLAPRRMRVGIGAVAVVTALMIGMWFGWRPGAAENVGASYLAYVAAPTIAVLPLAHNADDLSARTSAVFTDALQWQLRDGGFAVLSGHDYDDVNAVVRLLRTRKSAAAAFVVNGAIEQDTRGNLLARVSVTEANTGKLIWSKQFDQPASQIHLIATDLSNSIASEIRRVVGKVSEVLPADVKPEPEHWRAVYHARELIEDAKQMRSAGAASGSAIELRAADSTLAEIADAEPKWPLPWVLRARAAEGQAFTALVASGTTGHAAGAMELERGIRLLDSAITVLPHPDLFEQRGLLKYRRWVFGVDDVEDAKSLLKSAEIDLRKALRSGAHHSSSYIALSGVLYGQGNFGEAHVFARRAYDADVFLWKNDEILLRLFNSAFHNEDDGSADQWCREIQKVQPQKWPALACRIQLAAYAPKLVNVADLEKEIDALIASPPVREFLRARLVASYATTLARNGMRDSAQVLLEHSLRRNNDPELLPLNASALTALGRAPQAKALLQEYLQTNQGTRSAVLHERWFR